MTSMSFNNAGWWTVTAGGLSIAIQGPNTIAAPSSRIIFQLISCYQYQRKVHSNLNNFIIIIFCRIIFRDAVEQKI